MFKLKNITLNELESEGIIIGLFEDQKQNQAHYLHVNDMLDEHLYELVKNGDIKYSYGSVSKVHTFGKMNVKRIYFVGLGKKNELTVNKFRKALGKTFKQVSKDGIEHAHLQLESVLPTDYTR